MSKNNGEIIFSIEEAPEGGYVARALGHSIFTEADTLVGYANPFAILRKKDPFACFEEWASVTDNKGFATL